MEAWETDYRKRFDGIVDRDVVDALVELEKAARNCAEKTGLPVQMFRAQAKATKRPLKLYLNFSGKDHGYFAKELGISYSAFSKKLNGVSPWKDHEKALLAELLNVNIEEIIF